MGFRQVWICDECGKEVESDGYPETFFDMTISHGSPFEEGERGFWPKDFCSVSCFLKGGQELLTTIMAKVEVEEKNLG